METYLQPCDDGLPLRRSGLWVSEKLHYLRRYIDIFAASMRNQPWRERYYIDLFSGPGKCLVRETRDVCLGSPLLALTTQHPFTGYFFVDLDPLNIDALRQRCSASPIASSVRYKVGDSNTIVTQLVKQIQTIDRENIPGRYSCLNLAFLDPDGLELQWETVATLAQPYSMDLIIHYPEGGLNRSMRKVYEKEEQTAVDRFFGSEEWRAIYAQWWNQGVHRRLIDFYKERLRDLGYKEVLQGDEVGYEPLIRSTTRKAPLYRLLFACKHPLGYKFWQAVTRRDVYGQARLL